MDEDGEFEVTAEMLIHGDIDDEQTMVEAEEEESVGEIQEEVADLQQESELPLEELLKRYGYSFPDKSTPESKGPDVRCEEKGERVGEEEGCEGEGMEEGTGDERCSIFGGIKRVRVNDRELLEDGEMSSEGVKRVNMDRDLNHGELLEGKIMYSEGEEVNFHERTVDETHHSSPNETCTSPNTLPLGVNCSTLAENNNQERNNHITSQTHTSPQPTTTNQSATTSDSLPSLIPTASSCHRTQYKNHSPHSEIAEPSIIVDVPEKVVQLEVLTQLHTLVGDQPLETLVEDSTRLTTIGGDPVLDSSLALGAALSSPTDDGSVFISGSGGLMMEQQSLLSEEVGVASCHKQYGGIRGVNMVMCGGSDEKRRGLLHSDDSSDVLLVGSLVGARQVEEEGNLHDQRRGPKEIDSYSSDHLSSSDVRVHTPSYSSFSLHPSSSTSTSSVGSRTHLSHTPDIKSRLRPELPERRSMRLMANDGKTLSDSYFAAFFDDDEGDEEYVPMEEWKQEIRVGTSYQVEVDDGPSLEPYTSQTETPDNILWRPHSPEEKVVSYLRTVSTVVKPESGSSSMDIEQALELLQVCDHDVQRAIDVAQEKGLSTGTKPWSESECEAFEQGLRAYGKDFFQLRKQVTSRSVKELVEFYYFWKKSKRYDDFIQHGKIGKKKVPFQPGQVFDFMDNYLNMQDHTFPDLHYATTTVYAEHKKETV